jgi:conjugal transfer pilus assembly protein TraD
MEGQKSQDNTALLFFIAGFLVLAAAETWKGLSVIDKVVVFVSVLFVFALGICLRLKFFSPFAREEKRRVETIIDLPESLKIESENSVLMGKEVEMQIPVYLPNSVRARHVHILGATGSGKTESVILNFLKQDTAKEIGSIILDAKGDHSFLDRLVDFMKGEEEKLQVFDLGDGQCLPYNPLKDGSPLEASQRLFSSLTWSEPYYASKARAALSQIFSFFHLKLGRNPTLVEIRDVLSDATQFSAIHTDRILNEKDAVKEIDQLSGLRDQISMLTTGFLAQTLSPLDGNQIDLSKARDGHVIYFRLQSLMSRQLVAIVGKLIINHLSFIAGQQHRLKQETEPSFIPLYLDEFASFACEEFADLISKARSAGLALHFSHQSIGDLTGVSEGFLNQIIDNSSSKIVLRINDPDSAEYFARTFGTREYQKLTQRVTNATEQDNAEVLSEGTQRDAHQFRASPDLFKTLPTGMGAVLINHGQETSEGASSVLKVRFNRIAGWK